MTLHNKLPIHFRFRTFFDCGCRFSCFRLHIWFAFTKSVKKKRGTEKSV